MNKQTRIILFACLALLSLALIFASCDETGEETTASNVTTTVEISDTAEMSAEPTESASDTTEPTGETTVPAAETTAPAAETTAPVEQTTAQLTETTEAPHEHAWSKWSVTLDASCTTEGSKERTCACGEKET